MKDKEFRKIKYNLIVGQASTDLHANTLMRS